MSCPCFIEDYFGVCTASKVPYIPSIGELERYCFQDDFQSCPIFKPVQQGNVQPCHYNKAWFRNYLYSDFSQIGGKKEETVSTTDESAIKK